MRDATSQDMTESPLWIKMENDAFYGRIAALKFKGIEVALEKSTYHNESWV